ncbi:MAG: VIT1/CCC1 transporter family protein [Candidatus Moranbacteria bacterium]|nr:VIT1/CCC1 transporter family protein [Candidatus Moranbacteria bacterium]
MNQEKLGRKLVKGELFDLMLYRALQKQTRGDLASLFDELIPVEERHYAFWENFFQIHDIRLSLLDRFRIWFFKFFCRIFGTAGVNLLLEAIEINGIKKYLAVWELYKNEPVGVAVRNILDDEFRHEDAIISDKIDRKIHPERIRNVFLGLNDGLVEILGAVSGFFIAFQTLPLVLVASCTVAIAGAFSMAAGAFVAVGAEREAEGVERSKKRYLGEGEENTRSERPLGAAILVGASYLFGAAIPIVPVFFGSESVVVSMVVSGIIVSIVSMILSFLSGMDIRRRVATNLVIIALAVGVTAFIGYGARLLFGVEV